MALGLGDAEIELLFSCGEVEFELLDIKEFIKIVTAAGNLIFLVVPLMVKLPLIQWVGLAGVSELSEDGVFSEENSVLSAIASVAAKGVTPVISKVADGKLAASKKSGDCK